jgi:N6-adenosine-specific RNA methylase IME4
MKKFSLIYADPPWSWEAYSEKGEDRSAKNHYPTQGIEWIKALDVPSIAEDRSVLCMWVIDPMLPQALEVMDAWGFEYKTVAFYWIKENRKSPGFFMGNGYYTRANPEQCWLGTMKKGPGIRGGGIPRVDKGVRRVVEAPDLTEYDKQIVSKIGAHSAKPEEASTRLERLFGDVSRVELFARRSRPGWDTWGNEVEKTIELIDPRSKDG